MEFPLKKAAPAIIILTSLILLAYVANYAMGVMEVATDHSLSPNRRANEAWRVWVVLPSLVTTILGLIYFRTQGHDRLIVFLFLGLLIMLLVLVVMLFTASGAGTGEFLMRKVLLPITAVTSVFLVYRFFATR